MIAAFADFERHAGFRHCDADAITAGITDRAGPIVYRGSRRHHVDEFSLIRRRHQDEIRQAAEISEVKRAGMGWPVGADQTRAIHHEADGQALDRDVMDNLVIGALQKRRIDRDKWLVPLGRQARSKGHRVLLRNSDVKSPIRERLRRKYRYRCRPASLL